MGHNDGWPLIEYGTGRVTLREMDRVLLMTGQTLYEYQCVVGLYYYTGPNPKCTFFANVERRVTHHHEPEVGKFYLGYIPGGDTWIIEISSIGGTTSNRFVIESGPYDTCAEVP